MNKAKENLHEYIKCNLTIKGIKLTPKDISELQHICLTEKLSANISKLLDPNKEYVERTTGCILEFV